MQHLGQKRKRRNMLFTKLWRDMWRNATQFLAVVFLCALGVWIYTCLDITANTLELTTDTYFQQNNMADLWITSASFSPEEIIRIRHMQGVQEVLPRSTLEMDAPDLGENVSLLVHAFDGKITICRPYLISGNLLQPGDNRGILIDTMFAQTHHLHPGDSLRFSMEEGDQSFLIRGLITSPEQLLTAKEAIPDPMEYGFALINHTATAHLPLNQLSVDLIDGSQVNAFVAALSKVMPEALAITRKTHISSAGAIANIDSVRKMSYVFPLLCFAVAAMIVLTTLTRMMEKERVQMGILKALGYRDWQIRWHYLGYALIPSLVGSVLGLALAPGTLPPLLWDMFASIYAYPYSIFPGYSWSALSIGALNVLLSAVLCLRVYNKFARETTAALLRPKPPRSGNRILLERWTVLWNRLTFNSKMVIRSLARNKGRTLVTIVGVLCCNMLIICSLGMQDSMSYFIRSYYYGTLNYDRMAELNSCADEITAYRNRLNAARTEGMMSLGITLTWKEEHRAATLTVLEDSQTLVHLGKNQTMMQLPQQGIAISEKLASVMGIQPGDSISLRLPGDQHPMVLSCDALADTTLNQGIYMSQSTWNEQRKFPFRPTALLLQSPTASDIHQLREMEEVTNILDPADQYQQSMEVMAMMNSIFVILTVSALVLAFVICYNMGMMNFAERIRDYATLKVLGYHQREIRSLMMRESVIQSLIGMAAGIYPGMMLTEIVMHASEDDSTVFAVSISPSSILIACAVTFVFTLLIQLLLTHKVRSIHMVEALKSVE